MFWGLSMEPGKRYTQCVDESFHISQASLDVNSGGNETGPVQIILEYDGCDFIIATVSKSAKIYQVPLDLNFKLGDQVSFRTVGPNRVHLTGYRLPEEDDLESRLLNDDSEDDEEEEEDEMNAIENPSPPGKRKKKPLDDSVNKKSKIAELDSSEEEGETSFNSSIGDSTLAELEAMEGSDDDDDDEDDFGDEEDDEDDDDDEEDDDDDDKDSDEEESKPVSKKDTSKLSNMINGKLNGKQKSDSPKVKKEVKTEVVTPQSGKKKDKKNLSMKSEKQTPKQEGKSPKNNENTPKTPGQKKVLEGGVIAEELKSGDGPVAKPGKFAHVYYVGRLKSNNKQFDAATSGPGFKFRIGRGEVIKGWDVGVAGMKVGGKRRLTIPAGLAYGAKGSPPVIPPNSTLVFEVELRGVS